jgi:flagellar biogenesis protein FliO
MLLTLLFIGALVFLFMRMRFFFKPKNGDKNVDQLETEMGQVNP